MAWLLACFGYSNKRKRLIPSRKIQSQDKGIGSYQVLESHLKSHSSCLPKDSEGGKPIPIVSNLKRRKQGKTKNRKKVRFNLNVIAYEPVQAYHESDYDKEQEQKDEDDILHFLASTRNSVRLKRERSCSFTYRYSNCNNEEEDELGSEIKDDLDETEEEEEEFETGQELQTGWRSNPVLIPIENLNQWRQIKKKRRAIAA